MWRLGGPRGDTEPPSAGIGGDCSAYPQTGLLSSCKMKSVARSRSSAGSSVGAIAWTSLREAPRRKCGPSLVANKGPKDAELRSDVPFSLFNQTAMSFSEEAVV